jgi:hypothetical protein
VRVIPARNYRRWSAIRAARGNAGAFIRDLAKVKRTDHKYNGRAHWTEAGKLQEAFQLHLDQAEEITAFKISSPFTRVTAALCVLEPLLLRIERFGVHPSKKSTDAGSGKFLSLLPKTIPRVEPLEIKRSPKRLKILILLNKMVPRGGIEPPTLRFSASPQSRSS